MKKNYLLTWIFIFALVFGIVISNCTGIKSADSGTASSGIAASSASVAEAAEAPIADYDSIVGIARSDKEKAEDLTFDDIKQLIKDAVDLAGGLEGIVKDGDTVVLKPNLVQATDHTLPGWRGSPLNPQVNGVTTDYRVTRAVAQLVREINPSGIIYVMEGSATSDTSSVFKALNYTKEFIPEVDDILAIEKDSGAFRSSGTAGNPGPNQADARPGLVKVSLPGGLYREEYYFNRKLYEADVLINIPTLKNHHDAIVTGCIKNLAIGATPANIYGNHPSNYDRNGMIPHGNDNFHRWIADYYTCRPADFIVMDGLQGIQHGPSVSYAVYGTPANSLAKNQKNLRVMLASKDGLAIDITEANIINWNFSTVVYMKYLIAAGNVGNGNTKNITVLGNVKIDDIRSDFAGGTGFSVPSFINGQKLTEVEKTPPSLSIIDASYEGDDLILALNVSDNTDKLDIYIDGEYFSSIRSGFESISIPADGIVGIANSITVYAYTKYMFHTSDAISL